MDEVPEGDGYADRGIAVLRMIEALERMPPRSIAHRYLCRAIEALIDKLAPPRGEVVSLVPKEAE